MRLALTPLVLLSTLLSATLAVEPGEKLSAPTSGGSEANSTATSSGEYLFEAVPGWAGIPDKLQIGPTHGGVVVDKAGLIYTSSDSAKGIYVFQPDGTLVRTIAPDYSGIHGMNIREENGEEFIYAAHLLGFQAIKMKLDGSVVLTITYPREANMYPEGKGFKPTAIAVAPSGEIFVADGYGSSRIHKFTADGKYIKTFGTKGNGDGEIHTSHGLAMDTRTGTPLLLVCDRENRRLVHFDLEGNFVGVITTGLRRPCSLSIHGDLVAIAELEGRVAIIDKTNKVVATVGDNPDKSQWAKFDVSPDLWKPGIFTSPHGVAFDASGNLYVQDWSKTGRLSKLVRVKK